MLEGARDPGLRIIVEPLRGLDAPHLAVQEVASWKKVALLALVGALGVGLMLSALAFKSPIVIVAFIVVGGSMLAASLIAAKILLRPSNARLVLPVSHAHRDPNLELSPLVPASGAQNSAEYTPPAAPEPTKKSLLAGALSVATAPAPSKVDVKSVAAAKVEASTTNLNPEMSVNELVRGYHACWSDASGKFDNEQNFMKADLSRTRLDKTLRSYIKKFRKDIDMQTNFGFIEKRDLPAGTKIYVRADLHGDLKSLIQNLIELQKMDLLDENFKCKAGFQIILLGDYMDRGDYSLEIAELLAALKMENPDQVHLIRGNHEYVDINFNYGGQKLGNYLSYGDDHMELLTHFYETMPLTIYMAEGGEKSRKEYVQFTHGTFELHVDPSEILDKPGAILTQLVPVKRLAPERFSRIEHNIKLKNMELLEKELKNYQKRPVSPENRAQIKLLLMQMSAFKVNQLIRSQSAFAKGTAYNWGDVIYIEKDRHGNAVESTMGTRGTELLDLVATDVKHYMRLSTDLHRVGLIFRGHQHQFQHLMYKGKVLASTLPIGMDAGPEYIRRLALEHGSKQPDRAYVMTTAPKLSGWKKQAILRQAGQTHTEITKAVPVRSHEI